MQVRTKRQFDKLLENTLSWVVHSGTAGESLHFLWPFSSGYKQILDKTW